MNKINRYRLVICLTLLAFQFATPSRASACSCVMPGTPAEEFSVFAAVFSGKVTGVSSNSNPVISIFSRMLEELGQYPSFLYRYEFYGYDVTFDVQKSWKGISTTRITLKTGGGGGDCGYLFNTGDTYLVYGWQSDSFDDLGASICSRTTEISYAAEDLSYLNTLPTLTLTPVVDYSWLCWVAPATVIPIAAIGLALRWYRKRKLSSSILS